MHHVDLLDCAGLVPDVALGDQPKLLLQVVVAEGFGHACDLLRAVG